MVRWNAIVGTSLTLAATMIGGAQAYYVRQLAPGWPEQFHAQPPKAEEVVQIPLEQLQLIGGVLALAILCLAALTLALSGGSKKKKTPRRR